MSEKIIHTDKNATAFNIKSSISVGWKDAIPKEASAMFPLLNESVDSEKFVSGVKQLQSYLGMGEIDGKLGRGTWGKLLEKFDPVNDESEYWVIKGRRVSVSAPFVKFINFDQRGGLDLHRVGHFSTKRNKAPHLVVVHWGGLNPKHCYDIFCDPERKVSSHAGIGLNDKGEPHVYQYLDLNHISWHAGWANSHSVGIDICQQPDLKWASHYEQRGYNISEIANRTGRGPSRVLSIDPRVAHATREAVKTLCLALGIPLRFPRGAGGQSLEGEFFHGVMDKEFLTSGEFRGVVGHHHISDQKWDCACWWDELWGGV